MTYYCLDFMSWTAATCEDPECLEHEVLGIFNVYTTKEDALRWLAESFEPHFNNEWCGFVGYEDHIEAIADMIIQLTKLD